MYFPVAMLIILYSLSVLSISYLDEILKCDHSNENYCIFEQCFLVVLFLMLYKMVLTFDSLDEMLQCGHSNESY